MIDPTFNYYIPKVDDVMKFKTHQVASPLYATVTYTSPDVRRTELLFRRDFPWRTGTEMNFDAKERHRLRQFFLWEVIWHEGFHACAAWHAGEWHRIRFCRIREGEHPTVESYFSGVPPIILTTHDFPVRLGDPLKAHEAQDWHLVHIPYADDKIPLPT